MYFFTVCVVFSRARIAFPKISEVKHTIYFERPNCFFRNYEEALKLMQKATTPTSVKAAYHDQSETVQNRVYKSLKVWSMYADLEESFGTFKVK